MPSDSKHRQQQLPSVVLMMSIQILALACITLVTDSRSTQAQIRQVGLHFALQGHEYIKKHDHWPGEHIREVLSVILADTYCQINEIFLARPGVVT